MSTQYDAFAEVYETLFDEELYSLWADFTLANMDEYGLVESKDQQLSLLDMGCGSGDLAIMLSSLPHLRVSGYDLADKMIKQAKSRAVDSQAKVDFFQADMLSYQQPDSYDVTTLFCDTLCYLDNEAAIKQVFENAYINLRQDGLFMFDIHSAYQMNIIYPGYTFVQEWDDALFSWNSEQLRGENTIDHMLNIFIKNDKSQLYERFEELHQEQIFSIDVYEALLAEVGFKHIKILSDFSAENKPNETSKRIFFVGQK